MPDLFNAGAVAKEATGMFADKIEGRAKSFFGTSRQAEMAMTNRRQMSSNVLEGALNTFGMESLMQGEKWWDEQARSMQQQIKEARDSAIKSRQEGNMEMYRSALNRQSQLAEMARQAEIARKGRVGAILTSIGIAAATLLGAIVGTAVAPGAGTVAGATIGSRAGEALSGAVNR